MKKLTKNAETLVAEARARITEVETPDLLAMLDDPDVVVVDIPPQFGMLLSRLWGAKLKGTLQLDFSYATIPVFGQLRKLYREKKMKYMITRKEK